MADIVIDPPSDDEDPRKSSEAKSARQDMKQHADKLIRGFAELDDSAAYRGVWELIQNACDLHDKCEVTIDFQNNELKFTHNGTPFIDETLLSLIKQVSSKSSTGAANAEGQEQVGRFGTGFITTHSYGRQLYVSGCLDVATEKDKAAGVAKYVPLQEFSINRQATTSERLIEDIIKQRDQVFELVGASASSQQVATTTLRFVPAADTTTERENIQKALKSAELSMALVMALNPSLVKATIVKPGNQRVEYSKGQPEPVEGRGYYRIPIYINGTLQPVYALHPPGGESQILLPLASDGQTVTKAEGEQARLFLFFPLVGSNRWGCDFIIHHKQFAPTNERDGLHLVAKNTQVEADVKRNQELLTTASAEIFAFLARTAGTLLQPERLARIEFNRQFGETLPSEYLHSLQQRWVHQFRQLPLVETPAGRRTPAQCRFLGADLLRSDYSDAHSAIQAIAEQLWPGQLPRLDLAPDWLKIIDGWNDASLQRITSEVLAKAIVDSKRLLSSFDPVALRYLYKYWLDTGQSALFDKPLLPGRDSVLRTRTTLNRARNLDDVLLTALQRILPAKFNELVNPDFELSFDLVAFKRQELFKAVLDAVRPLIEKAATTPVSDDVRLGLLTLSNIFPASDGTSVRARLMPLLLAYYGQPSAPTILTNQPDDTVDHDPVFWQLLKLFIADFRQHYQQLPDVQRSAALQVLLPILSLMTDNAKIREEVLPTAAIFPSQLGDLKVATALRREKEFVPTGQPETSADTLKEWYREALGRDLRDDLVDSAFASSLGALHQTEEEGPTVAARIEARLEDQQSDGAPLESDNHPKKSLIIQIIKLMTDGSGWDKYFRRINEVKAEVMLKQLQGDAKEALFNIIGLPPEKIAQLSELAKNDQLAEIIARGQAAQSLDQDSLTVLAGLSPDEVGLLIELAKNPEMAVIIARGKEAIHQEKMIQFDFDLKHRIGTNIERLILEKIQQSFAAKHAVKVNSQQNGQDIIVCVDEEARYRIEVKSRWQSDYSITMSRPQAKTAVQYADAYALCTVDMISYYPGQPSARYEVPDIQLIIDRIRFVPTIGNQIAPLLQANQQAEQQQDAPRLSNEFSVIIPQPLIKAQGITLDAFVTHLAHQLQQAAN